MWHIIILSILAVHLNSCFNTPIQSSGKVSVLDSSPRASLAKALTEAKAISSFDPESKVETMIQAPSGALSGSSVMMPPGALNFTADLVIEESVPLSQTSVASSLNLRDDLEVQPVGSGLIIRPTTDVDLTRPLTIAMSLGSTTGLRAWLRLGSFLQAKKNYAVFYKSMINGELRDGVIPGASLRMTDDNKVEFEGYFGAFWLCEVNFPIETKVEAPTQEPAVNVNNVSVMNVSGIVTEEAIVVKAVIPEVSWNSVVISFEPSKRLLSLNAKIGADRSLSSCQVDLRPSIDSNSGINVSSNIDLNFSFRIKKKEAHALVGRYRCMDDQGRQSMSPWSELQQIPAEPDPAIAVGLLINDGFDYTNSSKVKLKIQATGATEMYLTNVADCTSGGNWEPYQVAKLWTLIQSNDKASVFVKFKNLLGDESKCLGDSIIHDDIAPKALSLAINSDASTTQSLNVSLSISAEAATEMYISNSPDCKAAAKWEAFKPTKAWLLGQSNSLATVSVLFRDAAGNLSSCISDSIQHEIFNFSGLGSTGSEVVGTWPDGTAKIKLSFLNPASSLVGQFLVYFSNAPNLASFDFSASPWQVVGAGDTVYNPSPGSSYIYVGGQGRTFSGKAYFIVRAMSSISGSNPDTNMQVSNLVTIAPAQSNFVYVPPEFSRLSYGYYIGTYEASLNYGSYGNDQITSKESPADDATMNLANCNKTFHENGNPFDSSCGNRLSTARVVHRKGVVPTSANWHQAYTACRNSSLTGSISTSAGTDTSMSSMPPMGGSILMRLPTEEEWRRASQWAADAYSAKTAAEAGGAGNCNTISGSLANTGAGINCVSAVGAFDMAGNLREWVDQRLVMYDIAAASESRFGYGPQIARTLRNGISGTSRRYHNITPSAQGLAMLLGSDSAMSGFQYQKQVDVETETWQDPSLSSSGAAPARGFRCVAFPGKTRPSLQQLAQANEPIYTASDIPGSPSPTIAQAAAWKIPENFYVKDLRTESISHTLAPFPNTSNLAVWNFRNVGGSTIDDLTGGGRALTIIGALANGMGLDAAVFGNSLSGSQYFTASDSIFEQTSGAFTMGGWFYRSDWASLVTQTLISHADASGTVGVGYDLSLINNGSIYFEKFHNAPLVGASYTALTPGWHHIAAVQGSATDHRLYIDGMLLASSTTTMPLSLTGGNIFNLGAANGGTYPFIGNVGNVFFHAGIGYSSQELQKLYASSFINRIVPNSASFSQEDAIKISWQPWTKTVCNPNCSETDDKGFSYYIYRYIEPTRIDQRGATAWILSGGVNPYTNSMPMNPMAVDSSQALLCQNSSSACRLVATVSGGTCNNTQPIGCEFIDSASLNNGFSSQEIYNYIMLVRDAEGNFRLPWVQRYRSPYFVGEASATASSGFRSEPRFRRASILLVDEAFQQYNTLQANSQVMSYVPMDQSGLDHDFFVQKYEPAGHSGIVYNNTPTGSSDWPLQASTAGVWTSNAAACEDEFSRTGNLSLSACGNGSAISATNVILKSKMGTSPLVSLDQGAMWKACRNTAIVSGSGYAYYESLISDSEWVKAADWGDVAETGTISQSQYLKNIGAQVALLESDFVSIPNLITSVSSTAVTGFSSTAGIRLGQLVSGTGISPNTVVTNIVPNSSITLSSPATASGVTVTLKFQNKGSCNTNTSSLQMSGSVQTEFCRSRYGMADHVGNVFEFSSGQQLSAIGFDNGLDGLWLARTLPTTSSSLGRYDLLRGLPQLSGQSAIVGNADFYSYTAAMRGASIHGGSFTNSSQGGRWTLNVNQAPSSPSSLVGGRCRR